MSEGTEVSKRLSMGAEHGRDTCQSAARHIMISVMMMMMMMMYCILHCCCSGGIISSIISQYELYMLRFVQSGDHEVVFR